MCASDKAEEIFKQEINDADVVVYVSGGVVNVQIEKGKNLKVIVVDADNADDMTSEELDRQNCLNNGVVELYGYQKSKKKLH